MGESKMPAPDANKEEQLKLEFPSESQGLSKNSPTLDSAKNVVSFFDLETLRLRREAVRRVKDAGIFSTLSEK
jgi:hypothetical protein